ncbi:DUF4936 family protein [Glaciimonas sp. PAMC28666]|uniref:DUF4936 family protein n=1 Tax=Glaciimonas sp. PAMC28666 TaxID=2807626 RepID=UPI0019652A8C|nr:DUF4936 family protein [Glaciimonas sp. PAMC28666]QRX82908.1 DUF4936 family protein [Glaciimonas sp. PAMC28666]
MDLYIYYRVAAANATQFMQLATAMQNALSRDYNIACALKRRPEATEDQHTWMEVYLAVPENFTSHVAQAVVQSGAATLIEGARHTEFFISESFATGSSCA